MPFTHHGRTPHTTAQQRKRIDDEITLEQAVGMARHNVDAEPFNHSRWERAVRDHTAGHRPAPTTGGTLSAMEYAEQLRSLGYQAYERALQSLNGIDEYLDNVMTQLGVTASAPDESTNAASAILGDGHPGREAIMNAAAVWANSIDPLKQLVVQMRGMVSELTGPANVIPDAFNAAAGMLSGGGAG